MINDVCEIEWLIALSRAGNTSRARDARLALAERGDVALPFLIEAVLDDTLPGGAALVEVMGEIGDDESSKRHREFVFTRENLANGLLRGGGDNAARALAEILEAPHLKHLRTLVCVALSKTGSDTAVAPLVRLMDSDRSKPTACGALKALMALGNKGVEEALSSARHSTNSYLRATAFSLWIIEEERVAALRDTDPYVRLTAIKFWSLPDVAPIGPWEAARLRDAIAELEGDLKSSDRKTASLAAVTLAQSRSPETEEPLIEFLCFGSIPEVKRVAAVALGYIGTDDAIPELLRALTTEKNEGVRRASAEALYRIGTYRCRAALIEAKPLVSAPMREIIDELLRN